VPSRKEIQWSQLKVGALVLVAMAVLIGLIFLMSGSTGGLFSRKLKLICYFQNANGLKEGAPVTLEGVTIGNVERIRVVSGHNPRPVEVIMRVGSEYLNGLHTDSMATITQAGVLGDSFVDVDSTHATGPPPTDGTVLQAASSPTLSDIIGQSAGGIDQLKDLIKKLEVLTDTLNSDRGTVGRLLNDPEEAKKVSAMIDNFSVVASNIRQGRGSLGQLIHDDTLANKLTSTVNHFNNIATALDEGKGTAGKLLKDDTLYNNLNTAVKNTNDLLAQINAGKGALGKFAKDPAFARKLEDSVTHLDNLLAGVDEGKGTVGQAFKNRSLYDHMDQTADQAQQLIKGIRDDPRKYMIIRLKLF